MNTIKVDNDNIVSKLTINCDTNIYYSNYKGKLEINVTNNCKVFEYINNCSLDTIYNVNSNFSLNRFVISSSVTTTVDLNKEKSNFNYYYSNINLGNNSYKIVINHNKPYTYSNIINNGINLEKSKLSYIIIGKVLKDSIGVYCNQDSKIITLDNNNCTIKPNLIIDNNDIIANHSSYIGYFNKDKMFYLMSRGLSETQAQKLLIKSFLIGKMDISFLERNIILKNIDTYWGWNYESWWF